MDEQTFDASKPTLVVGKGARRGENVRDIYHCIAPETYQNIRTKVIGKIRDEEAKNIFNIPTSLNFMATINPNLIDLLKVFDAPYTNLIENFGAPDLEGMKKVIVELEVAKSAK